MKNIKCKRLTSTIAHIVRNIEEFRNENIEILNAYYKIWSTFPTVR